MFEIKKIVERISSIDGLKLMLRGAGTSALLHVCASGLGFFVQILLARFMHLDAYGLYTFLFSAAAILGLPACLGLDLALLKLTPIYFDRDEPSPFVGLRRRGLQAGLGFGGAIGLAFLFFSTSRWSYRWQDVLPAAVMVPTLGWASAYSSVLRGRYLIGRSQIPTDVVDPILLVTLSGSIWLMYGNVSAAAVLWIKAFTLSVTVLLMGIWATRNTRAFSGKASAIFETRDWLALGLPLLAIMGSVSLLGRTGTIMVGAMSGPREAGLFNVAFKVASLLGIVLAAIDAIAAPLIAKFHAQADLPGLERLLRSTAKGAFAVALVGGVLITVTAPVLLGFFGPEFKAGVGILRIMLIGWGAASVIAPVNLLGGMSGNHNATAIAMGIAVLLNVGLNLALIPSFGILGAAWAQTVSAIAWRVGLAVYLGRKLHLNPTVLPFRLQRG